MSAQSEGHKLDINVKTEALKWSGKWENLDLLNAVDNEHVLQVFHGSIHPVVEGCCPLSKLQVQLVNGLPQLLHTLQSQKHGLSAISF